MKHFQLFILFFVMMAFALAQPLSRDHAPADQPPPEQRRAELRSVLKTPRGLQLQEQNPVLENLTWERRLSMQERAELRKQLGQQRLSASVAHP